MTIAVDMGRKETNIHKHKESAVCLPAAYSKTCAKQPLSKRLETVFQDQLSLNGEVNAGQKYCRMLQGEHSAILSTFIQLPFASKIFFCLFLSGRFTQVLLYITLWSLGFQLLDHGLSSSV